jgi:hypothetical protein
MGEKRGSYRVFDGEISGKEPLGRPKRRWEDDIKMAIQEMEWGMDWIDQSQVKSHLEDLSVDGKIILKWLSKKWNGTWIGLILLRIGTNGRLL